MLTLEVAQKMVHLAIEKAHELHIAISVAVVDTHGTLVAFARMDGALTISPKFASTKAYTAATLKMPTEAIAPYAESGKPYVGLHALFGGELTTIAGGLPITVDNQVVGGVGVGGSADVSQDALCAQHALAAVNG
jgi:uncharacterized protein GlcG (DUF336 family)